MHASVLLFAPALFSLLVSSSPVPHQKTAKLATRSTPFHNPNLSKPANPKTWEKIYQRAAPTSTSVSASTATPTPFYPLTNSSATATASATVPPADDVSSADTKGPYSDPSAADDDLVWVDDEDEDSYSDKREDKPSKSATDDDSEDDVVFHYLYDEPEAAVDAPAPAPAPKADKKEAVSKREVDYDEDLDHLFDAGTAAEDI